VYNVKAPLTRQLLIALPPGHPVLLSSLHYRVPHGINVHAILESLVRRCAHPLFEQTLADRERVLGQAHPDTLTSHDNLAIAYKDAGRLDEAEG
jgi:hypothetical protein